VAHRVVRLGFLLFVLVWLGWIAGAQLSIINLMHYVTARCERTNLLEPLILIIAAYTLASLIFDWARRSFCGWLCPFGALQELLAQASRALRLPQWDAVLANGSGSALRQIHRRRRAADPRFISIETAESAAEIEPFKTAITAKFCARLAVLLYASLLLAVGLFTERAYCRFLCPLGGVLAALRPLSPARPAAPPRRMRQPVPAVRGRMPGRAIAKSGKIVTAECFQCLDCQVEYFDDQRCPPLVAARRLERNGKAAAHA
jgi:polyferredoxin